MKLDFLRKAAPDAGSTTPEARKAQDTAGAVARLESARARAQEVFATAQAGYESATLEASEDPENGDAKLTKARQAVDRAERVLVEADLALQGARKRHQNAIAAEQKAERSRRWDTAVKLIEKRAKAAAALHKQAETYAETYRDWLNVNAEVQASMPVNSRPDMAGELFRLDRVVSAARLDLQKQGIAWAHAYIGDAVTLPDFVAVVEQECAALSVLRPSE